jgi:hypothetical protein
MVPSRSGAPYAPPGGHDLADLAKHKGPHAHLLVDVSESAGVLDERRAAGCVWVWVCPCVCARARVCAHPSVSASVRACVRARMHTRVCACGCEGACVRVRLRAVCPQELVLYPCVFTTPMPAPSAACALHAQRPACIRPPQLVGTCPVNSTRTFCPCVLHVVCPAVTQRAPAVDVKQAHADAVIGVSHKFLLGAVGVAFCWSGSPPGREREKPAGA